VRRILHACCSISLLLRDTRASDLASSRAVSMNCCAIELSVLFFNVTMPTVP
jgi:hypothetical protein